MNKNINTSDDKEISKLLEGTKLKADDKLKARIMQQIITEKALSPKVTKKQYRWSISVSNLLSIFGVMYTIIGMITAGMYFTMGVKGLHSETFCMAIFLVTFICGLFWMISCIDDNRRSKQSKDSNK